MQGISLPPGTPGKERPKSEGILERASQFPEMFLHASLEAMSRGAGNYSGLRVGQGMDGGRKGMGRGKGEAGAHGDGQRHRVKWNEYAGASFHELNSLYPVYGHKNATGEDLNPMGWCTVSLVFLGKLALLPRT